MMRIDEIVDNYFFHGRKCTKDCSGHKAGWYWAKRKGITDPHTCNGNSQSFIGGCQVAALKNLIHPRIRNSKGKFINPPRWGR